MTPLHGPRVGAAPGFEDFVAARHGPLLGLARVLVRHEQQAEDLVQDVLASALVRWSRVSAADDPVAYTNRMLVNAATSWRRRPSRRESATALDDRRDAPAAAPSHDASARVDARLVLVSALRTLSQRQRAVLALRYLEDRSDEEVADVLGITASGVRSSAQRGLAALRASGALDAYVPVGAPRTSAQHAGGLPAGGLSASTPPDAAPPASGPPTARRALQR